MLPTPGSAGRAADPPRCAVLTASRRRALSILHPEYPLAPEIFAHYMWPTSVRGPQARAAVRGLRRRAGSLLAELERAGLARRCEAGAAAGGYVLTPWGEHAADSPDRPDRLH